MAGTLRPDLLLLDVPLPAGRGLDLLRELRARGERVDAVLFTAASDIPSVRDALAGALRPGAGPGARAGRPAGAGGGAAGAPRHAVHPASPAPPSLDGETPHRVRGALRNGVAHSARELGQQLGLRYLEHLVEAGEVTAETDARGIGRPVKRYRRA